MAERKTETKIKSERHVTAGPRALAEMERRLGLGAGTDWRLEGFCALGEEPRLRFGLVQGEHRFVFCALPGMSLSVEGPAGPAARRFLERAAAQLGLTRLEDLVELLDQDPLSFVEDVVPGAPELMQVPCVGQPIALLESGWRNFYADQDFEVLLSVPVCSSRKTVNIEYADLECYYARPKRAFQKWTFLDWPEESEDGDPGEGLHEGDSNIVAELEERDMIMGTGERADALVAEVQKRAASGDYLLFTHLCTPIVMGEDLQGLARRCEEAVGGSAVRWSQKDRDDNDNFGEHFRALLGRPGFFDVPEDPAAVNLFHFPRRVRAELEPLIEALGLRTNLRVFPDVDFTALESLPRARWQVFCRRTSYPTKVRELLARSPRPVVTVPAPYGAAGVRACLAAVAEAAGRSEAFEEVWARRLSALAPAWEAIRKEAAGFTLGFVVSEATLPRLLDLRYGYGAPLATMASELGFGLELLYYDLHGDPPRLPEALAGAKLRTFRAPWELERVLAESSAQAFFSDMFFDHRLTRAGKARFSSKDFEMGLEGARRTGERLLAACRVPFFRKYKEQLAGIS